jgi:hypothetical protein
MKWLVGIVAALVGIGLAVAASVAFKPNRPASNSRAATGVTAPATALGKSEAVQAETGAGMAAIAAAAKANKYLFMLFWKSDDEATRSMRGTLESVMKQVSAKAASVDVKIDDPAERPVVDKFDLDRAPMPLILAMAPNGAITGGFPSKADEKALLNAFASPCTEKCMSALQKNKLVFVCVQNGQTKSNDAAMQGVRGFQSDPRYNQVTEIVMLNPADDAEASFLGDLKISPKTTEAITAFMAPPGAVIAEFTGATKKEDLISTLEKASSGCCPGGKCGPGGCAPQK